MGVPPGGCGGPVIFAWPGKPDKTAQTAPPGGLRGRDRREILAAEPEDRHQPSDEERP
jgi:hypothetical protein